MQKRMGWTGKLVLSIISIVVVVASAETIVRLLDIDTFFKNHYFLINRDLDYPDVTLRDKSLFWKLKPSQTISSSFFENDTIRINSLGLRGPEIPGKTDKARIVALGNSCTFGWGVKEDSAFPVQLNNLLGANYDVINAGVPGYTSFQGKTFFEKEKSKLAPNMLLIMFAWNDHWPAAFGIEDKKQEFPPEYIIAIQNQLNRLRLYRLLRKWVLGAIEKESIDDYENKRIVFRVELLDFESNLIEICNMAKEIGATPVLLTLPIPSVDIDRMNPKQKSLYLYHEEYNNSIRKVAAINGINFVDLAAEFEQHRNLFDKPNFDPIHFNSAGHRLAAELIAQHIDSSIDK